MKADPRQAFLELPKDVQDLIRLLSRRLRALRQDDERACLTAVESIDRAIGVLWNEKPPSFD